MPVIKRIALSIFCSLFVVTPVFAQVLDDEDISSKSATDETAKDEALFDELFSDYSEEERDATKIKTFGDAMDKIADSLNKQEIEKDLKEQPKEFPPLEGDIKIGITKNSFHMSRNLFNEPACDFTVTVKSSMNRYIDVMALNLIYTKDVFAFVFRGIKEGGSVTSPIHTMGDVCYNLSGVPDIDIHKCKVIGAEGKECAQRIEWSNNLSN